MNCRGASPEHNGGGGALSLKGQMFAAPAFPPHRESLPQQLHFLLEFFQKFKPSKTKRERNQGAENWDYGGPLREGGPRGARPRPGTERACRLVQWQRVNPEAKTKGRAGSGLQVYVQGVTTHPDCPVRT